MYLLLMCRLCPHFFSGVVNAINFGHLLPLHSYCHKREYAIILHNIERKTYQEELEHTAIEEDQTT